MPSEKQIDYIAEAIDEAFGQRCLEYAEGCACCEAWAQYDALTAAEQAEPARVKVKALEWEDADQGMCTKWRAAALGGHYELVALDGDVGGLAVNFHWGRPLSFWFIQGEPDECVPTGPKMFPTLESAKAAAQADYECRVLSALEPAEPAPAAEPVRKVVYEALRFANWAAGEGICPADGDPASAPEDFLMDYSNATGDVDWEGLANRIYTHPTPSEARLREALHQIDALDPEGHTAGFSVDALRGLIERMGAIARAALKEASDERA